MRNLRHFVRNDKDQIAQLTPREQEILRLLFDGLKRREIAHRLNIAVSTVDTRTNRLAYQIRDERDDPSAKRLKREILYERFGSLASNSGYNEHDHKCCELVMSRASPMEEKVIRAIAANLSMQKIAERQYVSPKTIHTHKNNLLKHCRVAWAPLPKESINCDFMRQKFANYFKQVK